MASSFEKHRTMIATAARSVQYTEFHVDVKAKGAVRWTTFTGIQKNRNKHFVFSVCLVLHWDLWLWVSPLISSSLTASLIEIMLSSAFSVTHTQKWDVSLPLQSVSVTGLTSGRASGHFTHFLSLSFSLSLSPSLHPLVIWRPDGAVAGKGSFSCASYFFMKNLLQGKEEWVWAVGGQHQWETMCCV